MNFFKDANNNVLGYDDEQLQLNIIKEKIKDLTAITAEEMKVLTTPVLTEEQLIEQYKNYYLQVFNNKLKELDYDSIATVNMWAIKSGSQFQAEAKTLLNWYEAIILKNYEIFNAYKNGTKLNPNWADVLPTKEEYIAELPLFVTYQI